MLVAILRTSDIVLVESRKLADIIARQTPNFVILNSLPGITKKTKQKNKNK